MNELWGMDTRALAAELQRYETALRQAQAGYHAVLAEMTSRGVQAEYGYDSLETLQVDLVRISRAEAKRRSVRSATLPACPLAGAAFAAGEIAVEHVDEILNTLAHTPPHAADEVEKTLVEVAAECEPRHVRRLGRHTLALLDPDGPEPRVDDDLAQPKRELYLQKRRDGRYGFTGILDHETGHTLEQLLSPLSKPRPAADGERDARSPQQRRGDGFAELIDLLPRATDRPSEGGERPTMVVTLRLADLTVDGRTRIEDGRPVLADGTPISIGQARRIACDAQIIPAVLGGDSEVLDLGRTHRLVTPAQRRALNLRDRGCVK
ncbi:MAG: DUF222 domain-containing protein, partial [Thermocrispum sp.]